MTRSPDDTQLGFSRHGALVLVPVVLVVDVHGGRLQPAAGQYVVDHRPGQVAGGDRVLGRYERVQVVAAHQLIVLRTTRTTRDYAKSTSSCP